MERSRVLRKSTAKATWILQTEALRLTAEEMLIQGWEGHVHQRGAWTSREVLLPGCLTTAQLPALVIPSAALRGAAGSQLLSPPVTPLLCSVGCS